MQISRINTANKELIGKQLITEKRIKDQRKREKSLCVQYRRATAGFFLFIYVFLSFKSGQSLSITYLHFLNIAVEQWQVFKRSRQTINGIPDFLLITPQEEMSRGAIY